MDLMPILIFATPVAFAALGETVGQKSGVIYIGIEGSMLTSAYFAMVVSQQTHSAYLGLAAGAAAGLMLTLLFSWFAISLVADQVVVGTAINLLALGLTSTLFRARYGSSGQLISVPTLPSWHQWDLPIVAMILLAPLLWFLIQNTQWGLAVRACGEYPPAVGASGQSVQRLRYQSMIIAGLMAGIAGSYLSVGISGSFAENMTQGRGFVAIAMVTFGRWNPIWVLVASLLIGYADSLQFTLQARGWNVPFQLFLALPYLLALLVLVAVGNGGRTPNALGQRQKPSS